MQIGHSISYLFVLDLLCRITVGSSKGIMLGYFENLEGTRAKEEFAKSNGCGKDYLG